MITARPRTDNTGHTYSYNHYALQNPVCITDHIPDVTNLVATNHQDNGCFNKMKHYDFAITIIGCTPLGVL